MKRLWILAPLAMAACGEVPSDQPADGSILAEQTQDIMDEIWRQDAGIAAVSDGGVTFRFASVEEGRAVLTAEDLYSSKLQQREIGIRAFDAGAETYDAMKPVYRGDVLAWSDDQKASLRAAIEPVMDEINGLDQHLPDEVLLVFTGDLVEGGLPHTRDNAIVFAGGGLPIGEDLTRLFLHELHHVLSRANQDRYDDYFALVGFEPCAFDEPAELEVIRLSNPDAPVYDHYAPVMIEGADGVVPFLYATEAYAGDPASRLPNYFGFGLVPVTAADGVCTTLARKPEDLVSPNDLPAFLDLLGGNTGYIIHPEETLADNFVIWAMGHSDEAPSPEIPKAVGAFWTMPAN